MRRSHLVVAGVLAAIIAVLVAWRLRGGDGDGAAGAGDPASDDPTAQSGGGAGGAGARRGPQAPASLSGHVTHDGVGVPNAIVSLTPTPIGMPGMGKDDKPPLIATTDARGAFTFAAIVPGPYEVAATALGLLPGSKHAAIASGAKETIDLALESGGATVSGTVTDVLGGPIRGARITVTREARKLFGGRPSLITLSDGEGKYKLTLAPGTYDAIASHDEYTHHYKRFDLGAAALTVNFTLSPGSAIRGIVVTREGKPVPDAHVRAEGSRMSMRDVGAGGSATTDAAGAFTITSLGSGAIKLTASGKGFATSAPTVVEVGIGDSVDGVKIVVDKAYTIAGRVVRKAKPSEGIPGVMLGVFSMAAGAFAVTEEPSAADGAFEIHGVRPGNYMMFSLGEGTVPEVGKTVDIFDHDVTDVVIEMGTGVTLAGRIEYSGPKDIADITLEPDQSKIGIANMFDSMKALICHAETDPTGNFTLQNAPPGEFNLTARMTDGRKGMLAVVVAAADQSGLVIKLESRASIAGKVVDDKGAPQVAVHVDVKQSGEGDRGFNINFRGSNGALTGVDGSFEIIGLEPGKKELVVSDEHGKIPFVGTTKAQYELSKGQKLTGVALTIESRDGVINGLVVDKQNQPVGDAWVTVRQTFDPTEKGRGMMMAFMRGGDPILTGADGKFTVDRLRRGSYDISVEGPKGASRASKDKVKTGETVTLMLDSLGSITGRVTLGGSPVAEFDLGCRAEVRGMRFDDAGMTRRFTAADGSYSIDRLTPGEYTCTVTADGGTTNGKVVVANGPAKLDLALQPWATISGTVVDAVSGKPIPNLIVLVAGDGMGGKQFADVMAGKGPTTDQNGKFLVDKVPVGKGQVFVTPKDATFNHLATRDYTATTGQKIDLGTIKLVLPQQSEGGTLGFFPGVTDGTLIVADVKPDTPAEKAGVQDGDKILAIDGKNVSDMGADVGKQLLMPGSLGVGQVVALTLERAGKQVAVTLIAEKF